MTEGGAGDTGTLQDSKEGSGRMKDQEMVTSARDRGDADVCVPCASRRAVRHVLDFLFVLRFSGLAVVISKVFATFPFLPLWGFPPWCPLELCPPPVSLELCPPPVSFEVRLPVRNRRSPAGSLKVVGAPSIYMTHMYEVECSDVSCLT